MVRGPELTSHLETKPETSNGKAGDETGELTGCYVYGLFPIPLSLIHFEFKKKKKKNPNMKHSRPSESVVFFIDQKTPN